jgi:hypothetical protein
LYQILIFVIFFGMRIVTALVLIFLGGCAKLPPPIAGQRTPKLLRVSYSVRGNIQPLGSSIPYYYFVLIQRTDDPRSNDAPVPVVAPPWGGNGFASSSQTDGQGFIGFVSYGYEGQGLQLYSCRVGGTLLKPSFGVFTRLGPPREFGAIGAGTKAISFTIDLNDLDDPAKPSPRYALINVVATSSVPRTPDDLPKLWDALGDGTRNDTLVSPIVIDTQSNIIKRNRDTAPLIEPSSTNDVRDRILGIFDEPNLDLQDWEVEVRN